MTNELCDAVTVFDSETLLPTRYVDVGKLPSQEFLYQIKVAPDGNYWYASFFSPSGLFQKFDAKTDKLKSEINLGPGAWSTFDISSDSKYAFVVCHSSPGKIAYVDLENMSVLTMYTNGGNFIYPKGVAINNSKSKLYVGTENGNFIYVINISNPYAPVISEKVMDGSSVISHDQSLDPHFLIKSSDNKYCFISCEYSKEIRMLDMETDELVNGFTLPAPPQQIDVYEEKGLLFVACPEDVVSFSGSRGSVVTIDYMNNTLQKINTGFQPYGLGVDRSRKVIAVANANLDSGGPAPHHTTGCGGRNGYITFIDLNTLQVIPQKKIEVAVFPRFVSVRK